LKTHEEHRVRAPKSLGIGIITVSTSRYKGKQEGKGVDDPSGSLIASMFRRNGHKVKARRVVDDDIAMIRKELTGLLAGDSVDAIILVGGTGLSKRDVTIEAVSPILEKFMGGFGEYLRAESFKKIGPPGYLTRAIAGVALGKLVYCLPGSKDAVQIAMKLILPEISHALYIVRS
jgi:molybdenum cofactor biosynthesis protein B